MDHIIVRQAHLHHLKYVDVDIPKGKLVVFTGVSGSGKSTLAFDLLFEEGRKRYLNSIGLSTESGWNEGEPFTKIRGLPPAIAVAQNTIRQSNPRSTVGTKTRILDLLCRLYSIEGKDSNRKLMKLPSELFAYNRPEGMCPGCYGLGYVMEVDQRKLIPDQDWAMDKICRKFGHVLANTLSHLGEATGVNWKTAPYRSLTEQQKHDFLYGVPHAFEGVIPFLNARRNTSPISRVLFERRFYSSSICSLCHGYRVKEQALNVKIENKHIGELLLMPASDLESFLQSLNSRIRLQPESKPIIDFVISKCEQLINVGLKYLNALRSIPSLSGGELQRLYLMLHLQSDFDSLLYIFDEPTAGLHEVEKGPFLERLRNLTKSGNSVIIVEHDASTILAADYVIEMGPAAGKNGGEIIYFGSVERMTEDSRSVISPYLTGAKKYPPKENRNNMTDTARFMIRNASLHNLKDITVEFPIGVMVGVCGVSGSGKSSLVSGTLVPLLKYYFDMGSDEIEGETSEGEESDVAEAIQELGSLEGWEFIKKCVVVTQAPIGRSGMSTPVTYINIWDKLRKLFAEQPQAVVRGYTPSHFSFNTESGGCPNCKGEGTVSINLGPIGTINHECPACHGTRYKAEILEVKYKGHSIYDVLIADVEEALTWFSEHKAIFKMLETLVRVGLGYLSLGQPAPTLSGGEAQRIKLAKELGKVNKPGTVYVLDEPTNGLGPTDIERLLSLLKELVDQGNTVILTEHKADVLSCCDWLIEMGPGAGSEGGSVIAQGTVEHLMTHPTSQIGQYLSK
ncbi:excinuclease ABC subunit UvrA [Paenibacillus sp. Soil787]|uniref:excinuclease ABC subunit UvrA n=1 Tax=Paenibacillus sp. Soil787 TaxID=1736411 RepID=UPI0007034E7D|nr:excinuclease ABC subunit UvrA [Paenibacillus sp. Soil787]KRF20212.1 hypothetical protein ASG93_31385 [Paenibacillus sp. Soil787]